MTACSVRDHGATGDGTTLDTSAIQAAIDQVAAGGGGRVTVPEGRYLTGTIYLRDSIELHLEHGATLIGSPNPADYNPDDHLAADPPLPMESVSAAHLVIGIGITNAAITGSGTIRGNSDAFLGPSRFSDDTLANYRNGKPKRAKGEWRPAQMVFFFQCSDITVSGVKLLDATYWTLYLFDCDRVRITGLTITNPADTPNGDGIDIVSCRNVTISDCLIRSGDDCLVFRSRGQLLDHDPECSDIAVTNCTLSSPTSAVRIGVADGAIRRVTVSNCTISHTRTGILIVSRYSTNAHHGATVEQIHFRDLVMDVAIPLSIGAGLPPLTPPAAIRDITVAGCEITASAAAQLVGDPDLPIERLTVRDVHWTVREGSDNQQFQAELPDPVYGSGFGGFPGFDNDPILPAALWGIHTDHLTVDNVAFRWETPGQAWRDTIHIHHSTDLRLRSVQAPPPHEIPASAGIRLDDVTLRS